MQREDGGEGRGTPEETFRSEAAYRRFNAWRHIHGVAAPHLKRVCIRGEGCHTVKHSSLSRPHRKRKSWRTTRARRRR